MFKSEKRKKLHARKITCANISTLTVHNINVDQWHGNSNPAVITSLYGTTYCLDHSSIKVNIINKLVKMLSYFDKVRTIIWVVVLVFSYIWKWVDEALFCASSWKFPEKFKKGSIEKKGFLNNFLLKKCLLLAPLASSLSCWSFQSYSC